MSGWLAQLHARGWIDRVEPGTTPRFRPRALRHLEGNRAAVYQLRVPVYASDQNINRTPTVPLTTSNSRSISVLTRASQIFHSCETERSSSQQEDGPSGPRLDQKTGGYFNLRVPVGRAQMLAAATELRHRDFALSRLSSRAIRALLRTWWQAGWTNSDLLQALTQRPAPGGTLDTHRCPADQLRHPSGWVRHRLRAWCDPISGTPVVPPSKWAHSQNLVRASHGGEAAKRLRYGQTRLTVADLNATDAQRASATVMLMRRRAGEFSDARAALRPVELIASSEVRRARLDRIHATLDKHTSAGRSITATPSSPESSAHPSRQEPHRRESHESWLRALDRARSEKRGRPQQRHRR